MKATGIVRRIDDLGRVVIPKEIRRTMRIREGDPLEIYTNREGEVIFKKYSPIGELSAFAGDYADTRAKIGSLQVIVTDRDAVIATGGIPKKDYLDKQISSALERIMENRQPYFHRTGDTPVMATEDTGSFMVRCAMPIISEGDLIGCVCSLCATEDADKKEEQNERSAEEKLIQTAAVFLSRQHDS